MPDDEKLDQLLDSWQSAAEEGRELSPAELCADWPELLSRFEQEIDVLRRFHRLAASASPAPDLSDTPPSTARYQFLSFIAKGGMEEVWRAYDAELKRDVAIKILKPGIGMPPERVREEAELVARLEHPSIVPVYDAGALPDGRSFFAMKLIRERGREGVANSPPPTLGELLDRRSNLTDDLPRFVQVVQQACEAVAYAHSLNPPVLHRDLKPSNIMVGAFGEVLVMDWGIAKVLRESESNHDVPAARQPHVLGGNNTAVQGDTDPERTGAYIPADPDTASQEHREETRTGDAKGTIAYMPPEQARGEKQAIGPAADVFALGGVLCAILTGKAPNAGLAAEAFERVRAGDLSPAFDLLDQSGADPELIAIAKKCLAPNSADRYADASVLARTMADYRGGIEDRLRRADVDRVRAEGERAQTETTMREERKRRRLQLNLGGAVLLALVIGTGISAWQARRAIHAENDTASQLELTREAERGAVQQKNAAQEQAEIAIRVRLVLEEMVNQSTPFGQFDRAGAANPNLTIREALDNTIKSIDGKFGDQPLVEAEIRHIIGNACNTLDNRFEAENQLRRALDLFRLAIGSDDRKTLDCQATLGMVLNNRRKFADAHELLVDAMEKANSRYGPDDDLSLELEFSLARSLGLGPKTWAKCEAMMLESLAHHRRVLGPADERCARRAMTIADIYVSRGLGLDDPNQLGKAEPLLKDALVVQRTALGPKHPFTLISLGALGSLYLETRRPDEGESLLREAIAGARGLGRLQLQHHSLDGPAWPVLPDERPLD